MIEYFLRQSIHIPSLVFQIGGGANFSPLLRHRRLRQNISVFDSKRCQRGTLPVKGVSNQIFSLILAVSYFKDMLITLVNEMHKLGGFFDR